MTGPSSWLCELFVRIYRLMLRLYPASFRANWGEELESNLRLELRQQLAGAGTWGVLRAFAAEVQDFSFSLIREHAEEWKAILHARVSARETVLISLFPLVLASIIAFLVSHAYKKHVALSSSVLFLALVVSLYVAFLGVSLWTRRRGMDSASILALFAGNLFSFAPTIAVIAASLPGYAGHPGMTVAFAVFGTLLTSGLLFLSGDLHEHFFSRFRRWLPWAFLGLAFCLWSVVRHDDLSWIYLGFLLSYPPSAVTGIGFMMYSTYAND